MRVRVSESGRVSGMDVFVVVIIVVVVGVFVDAWMHVFIYQHMLRALEL